MSGYLVGALWGVGLLAVIVGAVWLQEIIAGKIRAYLIRDFATYWGLTIEQATDFWDEAERRAYR